MCGRVHHVVGAQDDGNVGLAELGVDVPSRTLGHSRHLGLGQQHRFMWLRYAAGHRMDRVFDLMFS
jgi:hypothetical protein